MKRTTPGLTTTEEGGATEATPTAAAETTPAEGRKLHIVASMARTRGLGQSIAPLSKKRKKNLTEATLSRRSLSITPPITTSHEACPPHSGSLDNNVTGLRHTPQSLHPSQHSTTTPHTHFQPFLHLWHPNSHKPPPLRRHSKHGSNHPHHKPPLSFPHHRS